MTAPRPSQCRATVARLVASWLLASGCGVSGSEQATINAWLLCDHCDQHERDSVVGMGDAATSSLAEALRGPPPGRLGIVRQRIAQSYQPVVPGVTQEMYVARLLGNYVARYQKRAASALGAIGSARAVRELQRAVSEAAERGYRADVLRAIEVALAAASASAFTGTLSDTAVTFGDTVVVSRDGGLSWNGNESVVLNGTPFPYDLVIESLRTDSILPFVAVGEPGTYPLWVTGLGPSEITQAATLRIRSLAYASHSPQTAVNISSQPFPQRHYLALRTRLGDSVEYYRFEPAESVLVTAAVQAPGVDPLSLRWYRCEPFELVTLGPPAAVSGVVVDEGGTPIPGARLAIEGTGLQAVTDSVGRFSLSGMHASSATPGFVELRVSRIGFRTQVHRVQVGARGVQIGLIATAASAATARSRVASSVTLRAGRCWLLEVGVTSGGGPRIIQLRLTSP